MTMPMIKLIETFFFVGLFLDPPSDTGASVGPEIKMSVSVAVPKVAPSVVSVAVPKIAPSVVSVANKSVSVGRGVSVSVDEPSIPVTASPLRVVRLRDVVNESKESLADWSTVWIVLKESGAHP
jgi:hypothetical protein